MSRASASAIRTEVESVLARRAPAALTLKIKQAPELFASGIVSADSLLGGGIPRGCITEISGGPSTGKTSFAIASIAAITKAGNACAWVDLSDSFSPEAAAAAGVELRRLLWLRVPAVPKHVGEDKLLSRLELALKTTDLVLQAGGFGAVVLDMSEIRPRQAQRIPLATWYRFRLAAEHARTALISLTHSPCASNCAALTLRCESADTVPFSSNGEMPLFEGQNYQLVRERNRNEGPHLSKMAPSRADWSAQTLWTRAG